MIGTESMIKIIIGNYLLSSVALALSTSMTLLTNFLNQTPMKQFIFGIEYAQLAQFFDQSKVVIILIIYGSLLLYIFQKSRLSIGLPSDELVAQVLFGLLVPLTVISIILTLEVAILGTSVLDVNALRIFAFEFTPNVYVQHFIALTPVWILIHGLLTIYLTSEITIKFENQL
jgi:hypothetical protein